MRTLVVVGVLIGGAPASAQERVIGLLSLPQVFGPRQCAPFEPVDVALHASPNDARAFAIIRVDQYHSFAPHGGCEGLEVSVHQGGQRLALPTLEYDYEMPGVIVLDHRDGWFKVRLGERAAWLKASAADRFMPLKDLYEEFVGVTATSASYTGQLSSAPGASTGPILPRVGPSQPVRVIEIRESAGRPWVQVEVLGNSVCTAAENGPPQVVASGWLPLHDAGGEPSIWFSSRGCE
jgi:hypothetical protein